MIIIRYKHNIDYLYDLIENMGNPRIFGTDIIEFNFKNQHTDDWCRFESKEVVEYLLDIIKELINE